MKNEKLGKFMQHIMDRTSVKPAGILTPSSYGFTTQELKSMLMTDQKKMGMITEDTLLLFPEDPASVGLSPGVELCTLEQLCSFIDAQRNKLVGDGAIPGLFVNSWNRLGAAVMFSNTSPAPGPRRVKSRAWLHTPKIQDDSIGSAKS